MLLPALVLAWRHSGPAVATLHVAYLLALSLTLAEFQLAGYRKIPLTCPTPGFRDHLPMLCLVQFLGYELFTRGGAGLELWMLAGPWRFLLVPPGDGGRLVLEPAASARCPRGRRTRRRASRSTTFARPKWSG